MITLVRPTYRLTRESISVWAGSYPIAQIRSLIPPGGLSPEEVAALDIPAEDRLWALIYACEASSHMLVVFVTWVADVALAAAPRSYESACCAYAATEARLALQRGDPVRQLVADASWAAIYAASYRDPAAKDAAREAQIACLAALLSHTHPQIVG
jgi:hypothetical protein